MIIPVGPMSDQELVLLRKQGDKLERCAVLPVRFVPMTGQSQRVWGSKPYGKKGDHPPGSDFTVAVARLALSRMCLPRHVRRDDGDKSQYPLPLTRSPGSLFTPTARRMTKSNASMLPRPIIAPAFTKSSSIATKRRTNCSGLVYACPTSLLSGARGACCFG